MLGCHGSDSTTWRWSRGETMADAVRVAAVDLGATSGRVMACRVGARTLHLEEMHRFPNGGVPVRGSLFWDVLGIHREVLAGVREVVQTGPLHGIGIDAWAVDYGLLDRDGTLLGNPFSHRDPRTGGVPELVLADRRRKRAVRRHRAAAAAVQHALPAGGVDRNARAGGGRDHAAAAGPARLLADGRSRRGAHQCVDHAAVRRPRPRVGARPDQAAQSAVVDPAAASRAGLGARPGPPRRRGVPRRARRAGHRGRLPRHCVRRRRSTGRGDELRLHLLGHLVARRPRARDAGADRGRPTGRLHQRGRDRRDDPVPQERDGPLGAVGVSPDLGRPADP